MHKLLADQIEELGLGWFYEILQTTIRGKNGTEFAFAGLRHNANKLKSFEGVDRVWVEEAQTVSKGSWDVLIPTIRKEGSEIWLSFNPELETDETYKRFVLNPPKSAQLININWNDNPWFPEVLRDEMLDLKARDFDAYLNVWQGHCKVALDGAVYANELRAAQDAKRMCKVPYDPTQPVMTFWDLGWADSTSIWYAQRIGFEYHLIDFMQDSQRPLQHYMSEVLRKPYTYTAHYLPHDAEAKNLGTGRSIQELARATLGADRVRITPKLSIADGINAARTIFANCWFDEEKCADGIQALRHYHYDKTDDKTSRTPVHDWSSHAADAFRYFAVASRPQQQKPQPKPIQQQQRSGSWMTM